MPLHGGLRFALLILTAGVWQTSAKDARGFARGNGERGERGADASNQNDWQNRKVKVVGEHNTGASFFFLAQSQCHRLCDQYH
jgi:hypothetical protein